MYTTERSPLNRFVSALKRVRSAVQQRCNISSAPLFLSITVRSAALWRTGMLQRQMARPASPVKAARKAPCPHKNRKRRTNDETDGRNETELKINPNTKHHLH